MVNYDHLPKDSCYFSGTLYKKMNEDLQLAGMSKRTVHGYLREVLAFFRTGQWLILGGSGERVPCPIRTPTTARSP